MNRLLTDKFTVLQRRLWRAWPIVLLVFVTIMARLYHLQIRQGETLAGYARGTAERRIRLPALRGLIVDRQGTVLVGNRPSFDLYVRPQDVHEPEVFLQELAQSLELDLALLQTRWAAAKRLPVYQQTLLEADIPFDHVARFAHQQSLAEHHLAGASIEPRGLRRYQDHDSLAHLLGYLREANPQQLTYWRQWLPEGYPLGSFVGQRGLEQWLEPVLKGRDGWRQTLVDAKGRAVTTQGLRHSLSQQLPERGLSVQLTIDQRLQALAESLLEDKVGAIVALNPSTGEILALASSPRFDLDALTGEVSTDYWQGLNTNPARPLWHRALDSAYPPGSLYKMVVALALLEEGLVTPDETVRCRGSAKVHGKRFRCWKRGGHGRVNLVRSLSESCDVYYYLMGERLGVDRLAAYARRFGLGEKMALDLVTTAKGLIPTQKWKQEKFKEPWYGGETPPTMIGQGFNLTSPLQNAVMAAVIANGGRQVTPRLLSGLLTPSGQRVPLPTQLWAMETSSLGFKPGNIALVQQGLEQVIAGRRGTARALGRLGIPMAGKTGTAQVISLQDKTEQRGHEDHALFVGYAPLDHPKVVVSVIVEHGGSGSQAAAPLAGAVLQKALELESL